MLVEEDTMVGGCPSPMVSIKMGNYTQCDAKAMQLTVVNWSTQVSTVKFCMFVVRVLLKWIWSLL